MQIKITNQKHGTLNEADFETLGSLLYKAGYQVQKVKERENGKETGRRVTVILTEGDRK